MRRAGIPLLGGVAAVLALAMVLVIAADGPPPVLATGVGDASWTPSRSDTTASSSRFLIEDDSITYRTRAVWNRAQARGLGNYLDGGLRYTHEVNDRSGRLSATGLDNDYLGSKHWYYLGSTT